MTERKIALAQMAENVAIGLYQQDRVRGIEQVNNLVAALLETAKAMEQEEAALDMQAVNQILMEAMKALEAREYVLLADLLFYDLRELLV